MNKLTLDKTYIYQINKIKRERAKKRKQLIREGMGVNHAINQSKYYINQIYGKGWEEDLRWKDENLNQEYYAKKYKYIKVKYEGLRLHENRFEEFWID